jgi:hypothetical protein
MGLHCVSEDAVLRPPVKLDFSNNPQRTKPFVLNGSPMSNRPMSLTNSGEFRRKEKGLKNPKTPKYYNDDNYYTLNLNTKNIIGSESLGNTTLRFEQQSYTLNYIAVHSAIWESTPGPQLSMVFTTPELAILHLCIPIDLAKTDTNVNSFLSHWLYDETSMPPGFTVNELMNFNKPIVSFASLQYCLRYNNGEQVSPYTFFIFNTPLSVNVSKCPDWIKNISKEDKVPAEGDSGSYMRKTFDSIFNLMLHGQVNYFMRDVKDPRLISVESHFSDDRTQNSVKPIYYTIKKEDLYKKKVTEGFASNQIKLQNVKCYPINLQTQLDDNGSVVIDQETNTPIDIRDINARDVKETDPSLAMNAQNLEIENNNRVRFYIVLGVIGFIFLVILIVSCIYLLRGGSFTGAPIGNFSVDAVTNAAVVTSAAAVAKAKSGGTSPKPENKKQENKKLAAANTSSPTP